MIVLRIIGLLTAFWVGSLVTPVAVAGSPDDDGPAVYLRLVEAAPVSFDAVTDRVEDALIQLGWRLLAPLDCGVDAEKCAFRSRVVTAWHPNIVDRLMDHGGHAAFAVPVRFAIFEDEVGIHVSATNPRNLFRTIVDEETLPEDWDWAAEMIRDVARVAFPDHAVDGEYGQHRENSRIGRTMGIMAGGKFTDKIKVAATLPAEGLTTTQVADLLLTFMPEVIGDWEWDIHPIYKIDLPDRGLAIIGLSSTVMESRAFRIVGSGGDDARDDFACPGIDHAPAFPIEAIVSLDGDVINVSVVDEMYRMKMFFENAGKWAFARNMGMPGSIEDELKDKIRAVLN